MKTLFACLVAFLFALTIGCQESSVTDPVLNNAETEFATGVPNNVDKDFINYYFTPIKLTGELKDPSHPLNSYANISGTVKYYLQKVKTSKTTPNVTLKVQIYVDGKLDGGCSGQDRPWTVSGYFEEFVVLSSASEPVFFIEKSLRVCNTCCAPMKLVMKFEGNEKELSINHMYLNKVPGWVRINQEM